MSETMSEQTRKVKQFVERLCKGGHRGTCSVEELRAAEWMQATLDEMGFETDMQRFRSPRTFGALMLAHAVLALVAAALIPCCPFWAAVILAVVIYSLFGEVTCRWHLMRKLLPSPVSQNVIGRYRPENPKRTIILSGHLDSAQAGIIFHPKLASNAGGKLSQVGPMFLPFAALALLLFVAIISAFGGSGTLLAVFDWAAVVVLALASVLMVQWMRAKPVPGANDNASGIAAAMVMAEKLIADKPDDIEVVVLGFGAEETNLTGSIAYVQEFAASYDKDKTFVINFDGVAAGAPHIVTHEMLMISQAYADQELIVLARSLSRDPEKAESIKTTKIPGHTDALPFGHAGFKAISLVGLEQNGIPLNYHQLGDSPELMPYDHTDQALDFAAALIAALRA